MVVETRDEDDESKVFEVSFNENKDFEELSPSSDYSFNAKDGEIISSESIAV